MCKENKVKKDKDSFTRLIEAITSLIVVFVLLPVFFSILKYFFKIDLDSYLVFSNLFLLLNFYLDNLLKIIWPLLIITVIYVFRTELQFLVKKGVFLSFKDVKVEIGTMSTSEVKETLNKVAEELEIPNADGTRPTIKAPKNSSIIGGVILAFSELENNMFKLIIDSPRSNYYKNNIYNTENKKKASKSLIIEYYFKNNNFEEVKTSQIYRQFTELKSIRNSLAHIVDANDIPDIKYAEYKLSCDAVFKLLEEYMISYN